LLLALLVAAQKPFRLQGPYWAITVQFVVRLFGQVAIYARPQARFSVLIPFWVLSIGFLRVARVPGPRRL